MDPEEIERGFVDAGWEVPGPTRYPIVANVGATCRKWPTSSYALSDDPVFEIADGRRMLSHWVRVIITPRQAAVLLDERGGLPEEELGNPHKRG